MADSTSETLLATARAAMTPNYAPFPFIAARGEGVWLYDQDGKRYLDFTSGIGVSALGHSHPEVVAAIQEQAPSLLHTSNLFHHRGYIEMCRRLCEISFAQRVFLTNSGTEAMEAALKCARRYFHQRGEKRVGFVATDGSFHGRSFGAVSITGQTHYREGYAPLLPEVKLTPFADIEALRDAVSDDTAAVVLEPIQGNGGIRVPDPGYLRAVRELCDAAGCLLILDEIQTGVGRTGRWFAHQHSDVHPDIMTLAKAMGGGLPLGAMVTTDEIGSALTLGSHGSTFGGNPVACAAGLATLEIIERENLVERTHRLGESFREQLAHVQGVVEVRGLGFMVGVVTQAPAKEIRNAAKAAGLLVTTCGENVVRILPPLVSEASHLEEAVALLGKALNG